MLVLPEEIGRLAVQAILYEVAVTPKPGLVDRYSAGAHQDMDYFSFLASATALMPYFTQFAKKGIEGKADDPQALFQTIRAVGVEAEHCMFDATGGVNTHKGAIFSIGLACVASGVLAARGEPLTPQNIAGYVVQMTSGICTREYEKIKAKKNPTKGEKIYLRYGLTGVRGEAEAGFPSVLKYSYPVLEQCLCSGISGNESMLQAYLVLASSVDDTNVLGRHNREMSAYVKTKMREVLEAGGALKKENIAVLQALDEAFIIKNISPGGCADLLALTIFLFSLAHPAWRYRVTVQPAMDR